MAKKSKQFSDYKPYTYLEGVGKDASTGEVRRKER